MTFYIHTTEIDKARAIGQRALQMISFRSVCMYVQWTPCSGQNNKESCLLLYVKEKVVLVQMCQIISDC